MIAVHGAMVTLACAMALLVLLMYIVTIMINLGIWQHYDDLGREAVAGNATRLSSSDPHFRTHTEQVEYYYGSVATTMATLFMSITGGDWTTMSEPVFQLSYSFHAIWYCYTSFVIFGLLNVF